MAFFQNPFEFTFNGSLFGIGPQYTISYTIGANRNKSNYIAAYNAEPYDLSAGATLTFNIALDPDMLSFQPFTMTLTGDNISAVTAFEVVSSLNSNTTFSEYFTARVTKFTNSDTKNTVLILAKNRNFFRCYVSNTNAAFSLAVNKHAPVKELPDLFQQYSIQNIYSYLNLGSERILYLNPNNSNDAKVITNAGFDPNNPTPDWKLLASASPLYTFTKTVYISETTNIDYKIIYHAGAIAGQMAKKIVYQYDENDNIVGVCEIPYILTNDDLLDPTPTPTLITGTVWGVGNNGNGELGDDTTDDRSSPVQTICGGSNWVEINCGYYNIAGLKDDGTLWTWGQNDQGGLGDNTTVRKSSPIQTIAGGTDWKQIASGGNHTAAIKNNGTLWTWGRNDDGQLGDDTEEDKSSPIQTICGGTDWKSVSCGEKFTAAIKNNGTLWTWGENNNGQLGDETTDNKSSPVQTIAGGTDWKQISCGDNHMIAIKNNGTCWTWGYGENGELGDGTALSKSSPVQTIMSDTNWLYVSSGYVNTFGIRKA